jgi:hypothetical protein
MNQVDCQALSWNIIPVFLDVSRHKLRFDCICKLCQNNQLKIFSETAEPNYVKPCWGGPSIKIMFDNPASCLSEIAAIFVHHLNYPVNLVSFGSI